MAQRPFHRLPKPVNQCFFLVVEVSGAESGLCSVKPGVCFSAGRFFSKAKCCLNTGEESRF